MLKLVVVPMLLLCALSNAAVSADAEDGWPDWNTFAKRFVEPDGRVVDVTFERKSTSEGQSYGLFFTLVANQRAQFDAILKWTSVNLAGGQLGHKLPAWWWGAREDGSWGVMDDNSASDADLWIAYTLLEAARLWKAPHYAQTARTLLDEISRQEIVQAGVVGPMLLPAPIGFTLDNERFRLNPSYLPEFMFRYLAVTDPKGPWKSVWDSYVLMTPQVYSAGIAPDLFVVNSRGVVIPDTETEPSGSYDAIRVYLWAGMSGRSSKDMLKRLSTYAQLTRKLGNPPEKVNPVTGVPVKSDYSPLGFSGAILPFLSALDDRATLKKHHNRLRAAALRAKLGETTHYYDQVLILFGQGWLEGQYRFDDDGRLLPKWKS